MNNITFEQFNSAEFSLYENNPVIMNPFPSGVIADPSVLTPDETHDGRWHLFCHTFFGVRHYEGDNGIDFTFKGKIVNRAMRPNINYIDGKYYTPGYGNKQGEAIPYLSELTHINGIPVDKYVAKQKAKEQESHEDPQ